MTGLNFGDWNKPVPDRPDIDRKTGLPEGWTRSRQDIQLKEDGFIQINAANTAVTISLAYVLDEDGDRAGIDFGEPAVVVAAQNDLNVQAVMSALPQILGTLAKTIGDSETRRIDETAVEIRRADPGTNQQAQE
jgi:hypothetical protein